MTLLSSLLTAALLAAALLSLALACAALFACALLRRRALRQQAQRKGKTTVAFFHPFCNSGGGGERVLWQYVRTLQQSDPTLRIVVYTGDAESGEQILQRAAERFNLPPVAGAAPVEFVRLRWRRLVTAEQWPRFTMFGQSLGSVVLAFEALLADAPQLFVDTTGFAFTYPLAKLAFGCKVHCYTHYPTISGDMLDLVFARRESYNNSAAVASSTWRARCKMLYYKLFAACYSRVGQSADLVFVNSSWTRNHIDLMLQRPERTRIVFPPCDTESLRQLPLGRIAKLGEGERKGVDAASSPLRENIVLSVAQFRPEKDHALQLHSFAHFLQSLRAQELACPARSKQAVQLVLLGGARDEGDRQRVDQLKALAAELDISEHVRFELNVPFSELQRWLGRATVGLHTMWNEHFGIGVVEFMAAGAIPLAHCSGGPKSDIVVPASGAHRVGFLASSAAEYSAALMEIFASEFRGSDDMQRMREAARVKAAEFSDQTFVDQLRQHLKPLLDECKQNASSK